MWLAAALADTVGRALGGGKGDGRRFPEENRPMNTATSSLTKRSSKLTGEPQASEISVIKPQTKARLVEGLLLKEAGASLADLSRATGWLPHTCRAFLTGLRKKGRHLERAKRQNGVTIYKLASVEALVG